MFGADTMHKVIRFYFKIRWSLIFALRYRKGASKREGATGDVPDQIGWRSGDRNQFAIKGLDAWKCVFKTEGIGMIGFIKEFYRVGLLHNPAGIHDADAVAHFRNDGYVVRD